MTSTSSPPLAPAIDRPIVQPFRSSQATRPQTGPPPTPIKRNPFTSFIVVGDVHGDLNQLVYPLTIFLNHTDHFSYIVYLGDYLDRGESSVYIFELINAIVKVPSLRNRIIFLRGNHESYSGATYDYIHPNATSDGVQLMMESLMFDAFEGLNLDITFHDPGHNILFSHCSLTDRRFDNILNFNSIAKSMPSRAAQFTYSNIDDTPLQTEHRLFRNIHGHSHRLSSEAEMNSFFGPDNTIDRICIDNDASYGFRVINNVFEYARDPLVSRVSFLVIERDESHMMNVIDIACNSDDDLNSAPLADIIKYINETVKTKNEVTESVLAAINAPSVLSFDASFNEYMFRMKRTGHDAMKPVEFAREVMKGVIGKRKGVTMYMNEMPLELYHRCGELKDVTEYVPVTKLFWEHVVDRDMYGEGWQDRMSKVLGIPYANGAINMKLKGGALKVSLDMIVGLVVGAVVMLIVMCVVIWCVRVIRRDESARLMMSQSERMSMPA